MGAVLRADEIHAGYSGAAVLQGVTLELAPADFVGVIGPNGSGKTTLLRVLSRVLPPISGRAELEGRDIYAIPAREFARRVAVVPQDALVAFDFTVLEITLMGRSPRLGRFSVEGSRDAQVALDALRRTGTDHLKDRSINSLSGGERQRVMVARALAQEPEILLLDEPTSHLDISYRFEIMDLVRSLNRERGLSVLAVLHDLNLAGHYCDRLVLIGEGTVKASGDPHEVVTVENIRRVYGAEVWVRRHPTTHRPYVIAGIGARTDADAERFVNPPKVHVIGGGGAGAPIMAKLARRGYALTAGVLNRGDADQEVADALDVAHISQPQFSSITPESHRKHAAVLLEADVVVLTDFPVGLANLPNVQAAIEAARLGKTVVALSPELISQRDFTGGEAAELVEELLSLGARKASTLEELLEIVEAIVEK